MKASQISSQARGNPDLQQQAPKIFPTPLFKVPWEDLLRGGGVGMIGLLMGQPSSSKHPLAQQATKVPDTDRASDTTDRVGTVLIKIGDDPGEIHHRQEADHPGKQQEPDQERHGPAQNHGHRRAEEERGEPSRRHLLAHRPGGAGVAKGSEEEGAEMPTCLLASARLAPLHSLVNGVDKLFE
ncbi:hypothetical protein GW17_00035413 [Ensete ventricosum]|nr:hypothetical protein GW17_00035413 [Ensete ventricosum]